MYVVMIVNDLGATAESLWEWAWARHANELSWYIRPLFLVPLALAAYRRSRWGIVASIVAMLSSMFWFPAPQAPSARVQEFLEFEQEWLLGSWSVLKVALTLVVPVSLGGYCVAFWRRSPRWGLGVLAGIAAGKLLWGTVFSDSGSAMVAPAVTGLLVGGALIAAVLHRHRRRTSGCPERSLHQGATR